jgi:hypothetical protein
MSTSRNDSPSEIGGRDNGAAAQWLDLNRH